MREKEGCRNQLLEKEKKGVSGWDIAFAKINRINNYFQAFVLMKINLQRK